MGHEHSTRRRRGQDIRGVPPLPPPKASVPGRHLRPRQGVLRREDALPTSTASPRRSGCPGASSGRRSTTSRPTASPGPAASTPRATARPSSMRSPPTWTAPRRRPPSPRSIARRATYAPVKPAMAALLDRLRGRIRLGLLSNAGSGARDCLGGAGRHAALRRRRVLRRRGPREARSRDLPPRRLAAGRPPPRPASSSTTAPGTSRRRVRSGCGPTTTTARACASCSTRSRRRRSAPGRLTADGGRGRVPRHPCRPVRPPRLRGGRACAPPPRAPTSSSAVAPRRAYLPSRHARGLRRRRRSTPSLPTARARATASASLSVHAGSGIDGNAARTAASVLDGSRRRRARRHGARHAVRAQGRGPLGEERERVEDLGREERGERDEAEVRAVREEGPRRARTFRTDVEEAASRPRARARRGRRRSVGAGRRRRWR